MPPLGSGHPVDLDDFLVGAEIQRTAAASGVVPDDTFTVAQAVNALGFGKFQVRRRVESGQDKGGL